MPMDRRSFCASLAGSVFAVQTNRASRVIDVPASVYAFTEDATLPLIRSQNMWSDPSGIEVKTDSSPQRKSLAISVVRSKQRLLRLRLEWKVKFSAGYSFLGDAWERSYGDLGWRPMEPDRVMPWYFLAGRRGSYVGVGVETDPGALCFWQVHQDGVVLWLDVRNGGSGVELGNRTLNACTVVSEQYLDDNGLQAAHQFCQRMAHHTGIAMPLPLYGGNNWYYAYGHSSNDDIIADTERVASWAPSGANRPFMVIDDGWSPFATSGPWREGNARFRDMPRLAGEMRKMSVQPGLWLRPLTTHDALPESLLLKTHFTAARFAEEQMRTLDPTVDAAAAQIRNDVQRLCNWGYALLKHDFSTYDLLGRWGFQMGAEVTDAKWSFADRSRTNAEIIRGFYQLLRDAAGKTPLLGCNTIGHLATGLFEVQRTGDDTSGRDWGRTRKMGVNTLAFRSPQQGTFFDVDADCVGLTNFIPWDLNRQWLELLALSGMPLFVSAAPGAVKPEQRDAIKQAFAAAAVRRPVAQPLDWLSTDRPERWLLDGKIKEFDWYSKDSSFPV